MLVLPWRKRLVPTFQSNKLNFNEADKYWSVLELKDYQWSINVNKPHFFLQTPSPLLFFNIQKKNVMTYLNTGFSTNSVFVVAVVLFCYVLWQKDQSFVVGTFCNIFFVMFVLSLKLEVYKFIASCTWQSSLGVTLIENQLVWLESK